MLDVTCFTLTNQSFNLPGTILVKFLLVDTCPIVVEFHHIECLWLKHLALASTMTSVIGSVNEPLQPDFPAFYPLFRPLCKAS